MTTDDRVLLQRAVTVLQDGGFATDGAQLRAKALLLDVKALLVVWKKLND